MIKYAFQTVLVKQFFHLIQPAGMLVALLSVVNLQITY